jgi:hypothetical protein
MEKRLIKKETLAGIVGELAGKMRVCAPMKAEDQILFRILEAGEKPLVDLRIRKTRRKTSSFPGPRRC